MSNEWPALPTLLQRPCRQAVLEAVHLHPQPSPNPHFMVQSIFVLKVNSKHLVGQVHRCIGAVMG